MTEIPYQSTPADDLDTPWKDAVERLGYTRGYSEGREVGWAKPA